MPPAGGGARRAARAGAHKKGAAAMHGVDFDARLVVESYDGPNAVAAILRWTNLTRKEAEEAVLAAGGPLEYKAPARLLSDKELKEAMDAVLAYVEPQEG